jgi:hypothetical protein
MKTMSLFHTKLKLMMAAIKEGEPVLSGPAGWRAEILAALLGQA